MSPTTTDLATAVGYHQKGDLAAAEFVYRRILAEQPNHPDALHLLGLLVKQRGQQAEGEQLVRQAIQQNPTNAVFHSNLGNMLFEEGDFESAVRSYHRALQLKPQFTDALNNLGGAYRAQHKLVEAARCYRRAMDISPQAADSKSNLEAVVSDLLDIAIEHHHAGRLADAEHIYCQLTEITPEQADSQHLYGLVLHQSDRHEEAIEHIQRAISINPKSSIYVTNLATVYLAIGCLDKALANGQKAVQLAPENANVHHNLSCVYLAQKKLNEAVTSLERAIELEPTLTKAHLNLANAFKKLGLHEKAARSYERFGELDGNPKLAALKIAALHPKIFQTSDQFEPYRQHLIATAKETKAADLQLNETELDVYAVESPFHLQFEGGNVRAAKEAFAAIFKDQFRPRCRVVRRHLPRIGIVLTQGNEAIFLKSMAGVLRNIDLQRFEIMVFCDASGATRIRHDLDRTEIEVAAIPRPFLRGVEAISEANCDVLYFWEIGTDATNYFLPFYQLAPIQCTSWGIQVTSGIPQVEYYISSELVEPDDAERHYSESLILASTLLTYRYREPDFPRFNVKEELSIRGEQHLYLCAQNLGKFSQITGD